jgi:hypothetical protein
LQLPVPTTLEHCHLPSTTSGHLRQTKKKARLLGLRDPTNSLAKKKKKKNRDSEFFGNPKPISGDFSTKPNLKNRF